MKTIEFELSTDEQCFFNLSPADIADLLNVSEGLMSDNLNKAFPHFIGLIIIETQYYFSKLNLINFNVKSDESREKYHDENPRFPLAKISPPGRGLGLG